MYVGELRSFQVQCWGMFLGDGFLGGGADEVHAVAVFFDNRRRLMHARKLKAYG